MTDAQFADLIARGCAKVNISTALKRTLHAVEPRVPARGRGRRQVGPAVAVHATSARTSSRWPRTTSAGSGARARPGDRRSSSTATASWPTPSATATCPPSTRCSRSSALPVRWSEEEYGEKLKIAGGKERMTSLLTDDVRPRGRPARPMPRASGRRWPSWHRRKTEIYTEMVAAGRLPGRPGVARIVADALDAGWSLAVASTSSEASVRAVLEHVVGRRSRRAVRGARGRRRAEEEAGARHLRARDLAGSGVDPADERS